MRQHRTGILPALLLIVAPSAGFPSEPVSVQLITDLTTSTPDLGWHVLNDTVMGGRSEGRFERDGEGIHFTGTTNTDGGGFSSLRTADLDLDLSRSSGVRVLVKGDGRRYTWRLTTDERRWGRPVSYLADFPTVRGQWTQVDIPFADFAPRFRGAALDDAPLDPSKISGMGIMIYDGRDGPFEVRVRRIEAYTSD